MKLRALLLTLLLTICVVSVSSTSWAGNGRKKTVPAKQITDAAGRVHVRPTARISDAQRKAAAHRRNALRQAAQAKAKNARNNGVTR